MQVWLRVGNGTLGKERREGNGTAPTIRMYRETPTREPLKIPSRRSPSTIKLYSAAEAESYFFAKEQNGGAGEENKEGHSGVTTVISQDIPL